MFSNSPGYGKTTSEESFQGWQVRLSMGRRPLIDTILSYLAIIPSLMSTSPIQLQVLP